MKKILITAANTAKAYQLAYLLQQSHAAELILGDSEGQDFVLPKKNSAAYAHELLKICLDHQIDAVFPLTVEETTALTAAKVLFAEYDIDLVIPDLPHSLKLNQLKDNRVGCSYTPAQSYAQLSSILVSMGYPDKSFAIGAATDEGKLLLIDDSKNNFNEVWTGLKAISFIQAGKLLNHNDFKPVKIFPLTTGKLTTLEVLSFENKLSATQHISSALLTLLENVLLEQKLTGFYEILWSGESILRIKPVSND